jgi:hypothetical protein
MGMECAILDISRRGLLCLGMGERCCVLSRLSPMCGGTEVFVWDCSVVSATESLEKSTVRVARRQLHWSELFGSCILASSVDLHNYRLHAEHENFASHVSHSMYENPSP